MLRRPAVGGSTQRQDGGGTGSSVEGRGYGYGDEEIATTLRDNLEILEIEKLPENQSCSRCFRGGGSIWSCAREVKAFLLSPTGKALTRAWLTLTVPAVLFAVPQIHDWLGPYAFLMPLLSIALAIFATPTYIGVVCSLTLKLLCAVCIGQGWAFFVVYVSAAFWPGIVALLGVIAFVSVYLKGKCFQWGLAMCLAGTIFCFFTVKAQYVHFFQNGVSDASRGEIMRYTLSQSARLIIPALFGVWVPFVVNLLVWPTFMFLEFNKLLSGKICVKVAQLYEKLCTLYFDDDLASGPQFLETIFQDQQELFHLADRLPYLLNLAHVEGAWTLTNLGQYHKKVIEPIIQLTYTVTYTTRVMARFKAPQFQPDPKKTHISECVAFRVSKEADQTLHRLQSPEDERKAKQVSEKFKRHLEDAVRIYMAETLDFIHSSGQNLEEFDKIWERYSFKRFSRRIAKQQEDQSSSKELPNSEAMMDEIISKGMKETFDESEKVRLWFKSRDSFLLCFYLSAMRSTHALARICAENTVMKGGVYGRIILDFKAMGDLLHVIWVGSTSPVKFGARALRERPKPPSNMPTCIRASLSGFLEWITSQDFKIALRTACAVSLVASFGFIPPTAAYFDELSGLIAVGFVLFDAGSPYQGHLLTKLTFRIIGNALGIAWAIAAHYASRPTSYPNAVKFFMQTILSTLLVYIAKVIAAKGSNALDWLFLVLYTYVTYVGLMDICFQRGDSLESCDKNFMHYVLVRFYNLLIAVGVALIFHLLMFPSRAEHFMKKLCAQVYSDLGLTYGYLMSELLSHRINSVAEAEKFGRQCWESSMYCLGNAQRLNDLLHLATRELRMGSYGYNHKDFEALFGDCFYISRTLGYASIYLQLLSHNEDSKLFSKHENDRNWIFQFHNTRTAAVYRKLRSQVFTMMIFTSYCLQSSDVYPPHGLRLELSRDEIVGLVDRLANIYTEAAGKKEFFFHPDHLFIFDLRRMILILNYLCKDAQKRCESLFGTAGFPAHFDPRTAPLTQEP